MSACRGVDEGTRRRRAETSSGLDVNHVLLRPDGKINTELMWDLLHPSPLGTEVWVQAVEPTLAKLMGDKPIVDPLPNSQQPAKQ